MFQTYSDWLAHREHYNDLLREAQQERLARIALSGRASEWRAGRAMVHRIGELAARLSPAPSRTASAADCCPQAS
jgi:hypothetical protein